MLPELAATEVVKCATVASLGWVTPGAATKGSTPLFLPYSINQSISMNLLLRPTSKALERQKYSENTTV